MPILGAVANPEALLEEDTFPEESNGGRRLATQLRHEANDQTPHAQNIVEGEVPGEGQRK